MSGMKHEYAAGTPAAGKRPWVKPELKKIVAGSAEAGDTAGTADGLGQQKS